MKKYISKRVKLILSKGYSNYQGKILVVRKIGKDLWCEMKWDIPVHPCNRNVNMKDLEIIEEKSHG